MKKPGIVSFGLNFGKDQRIYKHVSHLSHDIGLLYSLHLKLIWEKYKNIRLTIYDGTEKEVIVNNHGYIIQTFVTTSKPLNEFRVYEPDKHVKLKILSYLQEVMLELANRYDWNKDSVDNAYNEVKAIITKGEELPSYFNTFYGKESWKTL